MVCSHFRLSYSNQAMTKSAHWWAWSHLICMGNLGGVFSRDNTSEGDTETPTSSFFPHKQVGEMVIMNDLE